MLCVFVCLCVCVCVCVFVCTCPKPLSFTDACMPTFSICYWVYTACMHTHIHTHAAYCVHMCTYTWPYTINGSYVVQCPTYVCNETCTVTHHLNDIVAFGTICTYVLSYIPTFSLLMTIIPQSLSHFKLALFLL